MIVLLLQPSKPMRVESTYVLVLLQSGRRMLMATIVSQHLAKLDATLFVVMMIELYAMMALLMAHVLMAFTTQQTETATQS